MNKTTAVSAWAMSGLFDLYFAFSIEGLSFNKQKVFYNAMGLEKILKAYFISIRSSEYKNLNLNDSKAKIENIAKSYGHQYKNMIKTIKKDKGLKADINAIMKKPYMTINNTSYSGSNFLKALEKIYQESRYPSAAPVSRSFVANKFFEVDPINSSALIDLIYDLSILILNHLKNQINFLPRIEKIEGYHSEIDAWIRFKRVFFKTTNGDIIQFFT